MATPCDRLSNFRSSSVTTNALSGDTNPEALTRDLIISSKDRIYLTPNDGLGADSTNMLLITGTTNMTGSLAVDDLVFSQNQVSTSAGDLVIQSNSGAVKVDNVVFTNASLTPGTDVDLSLTGGVMEASGPSETANNSEQEFLEVPEWAYRVLGGKKAFLQALAENHVVEKDYKISGVRKGSRQFGKVYATPAVFLSLGIDTEKRTKNDTAAPDRTLKEFEIRDKTAASLGGVREIRCPAGIIDILCPRQRVLIEVKTFNRWMEGLGQLMAYGRYYPDFKKRLHLFRTSTMPGSCCLKKLLTVHETCIWAGVELTLDESIEISHAVPDEYDPETAPTQQVVPPFG
eukprot:jgi/Mesvir1/18318/Mv18471-RA.1